MASEKMLGSFDVQDSIADDDLVLGYDKSEAKVKNFKFGTGIWNFVVDKLTNAVVAKLNTTNKTMIGAINELNSKTFSYVKVFGGINVKCIEIIVNSKNALYGVLIFSNNFDSQICNIAVSPTLNTTVGRTKIEIDNLTMRITFNSKNTHYACILGGSIANGTIKEIKE